MPLKKSKVKSAANPGDVRTAINIDKKPV